MTSATSVAEALRRLGNFASDFAPNRARDMREFDSGFSMEDLIVQVEKDTLIENIGKSMDKHLAAHATGQTVC